MIYKTLEDHIEELCPNCNTKHESKWEPEFEHFTCYKKQKCNNCGYTLFKKLDFSSDGTILV
ncbi:hypothetical protein KO361_00630 [Candidatus Woesearchaeota archaeon]|nr:hypothetical protein [Candidatus Woesearchaeota archaeon]